MPIIFEQDKNKYTPKRLNKTFTGKALYLPKSKCKDGDGIMDIFKLIANNKDLISSVAGSAGSVIDAGSKLSNLTLDSISKVKDIRKSLSKMRNLKEKL